MTKYIIAYKDLNGSLFASDNNHYNIAMLMDELEFYKLIDTDWNVISEEFSEVLVYKTYDEFDIFTQEITEIGEPMIRCTSITY